MCGRGYAQPLERLWPGVTVVKQCTTLVQVQGAVKKQMILNERAALVAHWQQQREEEARRDADIQAAEAAEKSVKPPEPARLHAPQVAFGTLSVEYSLPVHAETKPPSTKEFGLFAAGQRDSWYKVGEVQGKREGVINLDVQGIPPGDYDLGSLPPVPTLSLLTLSIQHLVQGGTLERVSCVGCCAASWTRCVVRTARQAWWRRAT